MLKIQNWVCRLIRLSLYLEIIEYGVTGLSCVHTSSTVSRRELIVAEYMTDILVRYC
jgi:hypothetical protein